MSDRAQPVNSKPVRKAAPAGGLSPQSYHSTTPPGGSFQSILGNMAAQSTPKALQQIPAHLAAVARDNLARIIDGMSHCPGATPSEEARDKSGEMLQDGYVSGREWFDQFGHNYESRLNFLLYDRDGDGRINETELRMRRPTSSDQLTTNQRMDIAALYLSDRYGGAFSRWKEALRGGRITREEFRTIRGTNSGTDQAFQVLDNNRDGQIATEEILGWMFFIMPKDSRINCLGDDEQARGTPLHKPVPPPADPLDP